MDEREKGSVVDDDDGSDAIRDVHDDKSVWTNSIRFGGAGRIKVYKTYVRSGQLVR